MALQNPKCTHENQLWIDGKKQKLFPDPTNHLVCCWSLCCVQVIKMYKCNKCKKSTSVKTSYRYRTKTMPPKIQDYQKYMCNKQFDRKLNILKHTPKLLVLKHSKCVKGRNNLNCSSIALCTSLEHNTIRDLDKVATDQTIIKVSNKASDKKLSQTTKKKSYSSSSSFLKKMQQTHSKQQSMELKSLDDPQQIHQMKPIERQDVHLTPKKKARKFTFQKKAFKRSPKVGIAVCKVKREHVCTQCGKTFMLPNRLQRHMKVHTGVKPYKCNLCGKGFSSNQSLKNHNKFLETSNLRCDICGIQFCTNFTFTTHKMSHSLSSQTEQRNMDKHQTLHCNWCEKVFDSLVALSSHTSVHENIQLNNTEMSGIAFIEQGDPDECLKSNINTDRKRTHITFDSKSETIPKTTPKQHKVYHCGTCAKTFHQESYYRVHMLSHTKQNIPISKGGQLQGDKVFLCDLCPERFSTKAYLMAHTISHTDKSLTCIICHKPYRYFSRLSEHMLFHTREKPYRCSVCGKNYPYYGSLQSHMLIHTDLRPFKCEVCHQSFIKKCELVKHLSIHTGDKHHMCEECGKCFRTWSSLRMHDKTHTGEKPHKCNHCGKGFVTRGHLKTHLRIHTGEKPYCCEICGKQCAIKGNLHKHMATHRKNKSDNKEIEMKDGNTENSFIDHNLYHEHTSNVFTNPSVYDSYLQAYAEPKCSFQHEGMYQNI